MPEIKGTKSLNTRINTLTRFWPNYFIYWVNPGPTVVNNVGKVLWS